MPAELVVFIVGMACAVLGGLLSWWCFAVPAIADARENTVSTFAAMSPEEIDEFRRLWERRQRMLRRIAREDGAA